MKLDPADPGQGNSGTSGELLLDLLARRCQRRYLSEGPLEDVETRCRHRAIAAWES